MKLKDQINEGINIRDFDDLGDEIDHAIDIVESAGKFIKKNSKEFPDIRATLEDVKMARESLGEINMAIPG
jgi:hypothetical protein